MIYKKVHACFMDVTDHDIRLSLTGLCKICSDYVIRVVLTVEMFDSMVYL